MMSGARPDSLTEEEEMIAVTPKKERKWCTRGDLTLDDADRTMWIIRDLTERERVTLNDSVQISVNPLSGAVSQGLGTRVYITLKCGLVDIAEGYFLKDEEGKNVPFLKDKNGQVADEFLERLPWEVQQEMFVAITSSAVLEEEEKEA
tara:strand:- start:14991 stop:15434 length:444 start_codon:yes stop_codon:yes gene_type:complete